MSVRWIDQAFLPPGGSQTRSLYKLTNRRMSEAETMSDEAVHASLVYFPYGDVHKTNHIFAIVIVLRLYLNTVV